jgi:hypothetical protein
LPAADDDVIERIPRADSLSAAQVFGVEHHAVLDPGLAFQQGVDHPLPVFAIILEQESQPAMVDAQDGDTTWRAQVRSAQHGPVAADRHQQVELTLLHLLAQTFIVERSVRCIEALAFEVLRDGPRCLECIRQLGVGGDHYARRDECLIHKFYIIAG